jgi:hypothetical protein
MEWIFPPRPNSNCPRLTSQGCLCCIFEIFDLFYFANIVWGKTMTTFIHITALIPPPACSAPYKRARRKGVSDATYRRGGFARSSSSIHLFVCLANDWWPGYELRYVAITYCCLWFLYDSVWVATTTTGASYIYIQFLGHSRNSKPKEKERHSWKKILTIIITMIEP